MLGVLLSDSSPLVLQITHLLSTELRAFYAKDQPERPGRERSVVPSKHLVNASFHETSR
jgi:hypothetical protein